MNVVIQTAKNILGFADAISYLVRYALAFINTICPSNIAVMFSIAFTVMVAVAVKRGVAT